MRISTKNIFFIICLMFSNILWAAESSPLPMLEKTAGLIISALEENKSQLKKNPQLIYQTVEKYFLPQVDVQGMARSVLGRQVWNKATPAERSKFAQAFTRLVIRTYTTPIAEFTDEKIKFLPVRSSENSRFVRVNSLIVRSSGQNIPLNYSLVQINGSWKIYDMSVEGVSLLQSFRSQFAQALQNSNIESLVQQMDAQKKKAS